MKKLLVLTPVAAFAAFAWLSLPSPDQAGTAGAPQQTATGIGVVQRIDQEQGVVTIAHGPLLALNMMPMTMSYRVKDRSQLSGLQPTQKVEFQITYDGKDYLVTEIR
jgi:Cu(I)/Ag(I) efflux system periplasmic protein CusF